ncbi:hypothetical protein OKW37_001718 [Paraburkholderia sp. MM5482-R2]
MRCKNIWFELVPTFSINDALGSRSKVRRNVHRNIWHEISPQLHMAEMN